MATTKDVPSATDTAMGNERMNSPMGPVTSSRMGTNEPMMVNVAINTGTAICVAHFHEASSTGILRSSSST
jgi:hypothetical protein